MNNTYFQDAEDALTECDQLTDDDRPDSEDRATIAAFYNGRATMNTCEAENRGITELTNHLFGYDSINTASEQVFGIYSKSPTLFVVNTKNAPDGLDQRWGMKTTEFLNKAIKKSQRFKPEFKAFAGEVTLDGSFHFCYYDLYDWCPRARRPLAPRGTSTIPADGDYFAIREDLRLKDLYAYLKRSERLRDQGFDSGWNIKGLKAAIKMIEAASKSSTSTTDRNTASESSHTGPTPEEQEDDIQIDSTDTERQRLTLPVYYLYTSRPDEKGTPFDFTILARYPVDVKKQATEDHVTLSAQLFDKERHFPKATDFLHSFFIDCNIGGKTLFHKSMGLGRLNFDVDVEELFNEAMQSSKENLRRLFQVSNAADVETVNRWLSGSSYNNILPEGVNVAEVTKQPNAQFAMQPLSMLMQQGKVNAAGAHSSAGEKGKDELEVQALERQGRNANAIASRMNEIYDNLTVLGETMFDRFLNTNIMPSDRGYDEIHWFQEKMKDEGIPLKFLKKMTGGRFENVEIRVNRNAGDGDKVRQAMVNRALEARLPLYNPQAQNEILRMITATEIQDYDKAEELVPREQKLDGGQVNVANNENQSSIHRGITEYVPELNRDDIHMIHIPEHFGGAGALIKKGEIAGWDQFDIAGFASIMAHLKKHLEAVSGNPAAKDLINQVSQGIEAMMRQAREFINNFQQKQQAEQEQPDPIQMGKLQLDNQKFQQGQMEHQDLVGHREESLDLSRQKAGMQGKLQLRQQDIQIGQSAQSDLSGKEAHATDTATERLKMEQQAKQQAQQEIQAGNRRPQGNKNQ